MSTDGLAHHGVLAHEHMGDATQTHADLLHLLRAHVVGPDDEAFWIVIQKPLKRNKPRVSIEGCDRGTRVLAASRLSYSR
jgi:hypothetical protein